MSQNTQEKTDDSSQPLQNQTKGVKALLGDPKKAILTLSLPMIVAMIGPNTCTVWLIVSGFLVLDQSFSRGWICVPACSSWESRLLQALELVVAQRSQERSVQKIRKGRISSSPHLIIMVIRRNCICTIPLFVFSEDIFRAIGAGEATAIASLYARIISFNVSIMSFFTFIATAFFDPKVMRNDRCLQ